MFGTVSDGVELAGDCPRRAKHLLLSHLREMIGEIKPQDQTTMRRRQLPFPFGTVVVGATFRPRHRPTPARCPCSTSVLVSMHMSYSPCMHHSLPTYIHIFNRSPDTFIHAYNDLHPSRPGLGQHPIRHLSCGLIASPHLEAA